MDERLFNQVSNIALAFICFNIKCEAIEKVVNCGLISNYIFFTISTSIESHLSGQMCKNVYSRVLVYLSTCLWTQTHV